MAGRKKRKTRNLTDQELLHKIKEAISKGLDEGNINLKVSDLLKILEIQKELSKDSGVEEKFWEYIDQIRQEELGDE